MAKSKKVQKPDTTTEEKIKDAARTVFYKKGFAATRTRDIAEEAGMNLALLNYYFRSKAKLFEMIMIETLSVFFQDIVIVINDETTSLEKKIQEITSRYIDLLAKEPEIPTFIMTEVRSNPGIFLKKLPVRQAVFSSAFFRQYQKAVTDGKITESDPLQFLINLLGLTIFPFIAQPIIMNINGLNVRDFNQFVQKRKKLIPIWLKAIMKAK
ncbi:TetR/AcrR family transcriptional regulator [Niabella aquatica]